MLQFIEEPISYDEARRAVKRFEHAYKVSSAVVFSGHGGADPRIGEDVLFEWRSHYEFVRDVDNQLAEELAETNHWAFSSHPLSETCTKTSEERKQAALAYAA